MQCATCERKLEVFTGDVCPHCQHFAHPTRLGIYENLELVKRGGMGSVYKARHPELGTSVAIKTVYTPTGPETLGERFEREARMAARIPHPGVVRVFDYDCQEGRLYLVMEFVEGLTLRQHIEERGREVRWCLDKIAQLADILQAAHEHGVIHRDIKPENVMVDTTGRVRVLDFGISRALEDEDRLTRTGEILGTPEYIAPEQVLDVPEAVDRRTDVYATGVVLYELLTGHSPFAGNNLFQVLKLVESRVPPPPSHLTPGIPEQLDDLVMAAIAKEKDDRPADGRALARQLREIAAHMVSTPRTDRHWFANLAFALVCMAVGSGIAFWVGDTSRADADADRPQSPIATIRNILVVDPPWRRGPLRSASRLIPDDAPAKDLYWRGMARKNTGAVFLALQDFEQARDQGVEAARVQAAITALYKHKLYPATHVRLRWLGAAFDPGLTGDEPMTRGIYALGKNQYVDAARHFGAATDAAPDRQVLAGLSLFLAGEFRASVVAIEDIVKTHGDYIPLRILRAIQDNRRREEALRDIVQEIDRLAPLRYLLEAVTAVDPRAALELATTTGEAEFTTAVFVTMKVAAGIASTPEHERTALARFAAELGKTKKIPGIDIARVFLARAATPSSEPIDSILPMFVDDDDPVAAWVQSWARAHAAGSEDLPFYEGIATCLARDPTVGGLAVVAWAKKRWQTPLSEEQLARMWTAATLLPERDLPNHRLKSLQDGLYTLVSAGVSGGSNLQRMQRHLLLVQQMQPVPVHRMDVVSMFNRGVKDQLNEEQFVTLLRVFYATSNDLAPNYEQSSYEPLKAAALRMTHVGNTSPK